MRVCVCERESVCVCLCEFVLPSVMRSQTSPHRPTPAARRVCECVCVCLLRYQEAQLISLSVHELMMMIERNEETVCE